VRNDYFSGLVYFIFLFWVLTKKGAREMKLLIDRLQIAQGNNNADELIPEVIEMLCQQQAEIEALKQVLQSIANEHVELSHDKIKWQCDDHIRWAKEALK